MAPRKPAPKASKPVAKPAPKAAVKPAVKPAVKKSNLTVWPAATAPLPQPASPLAMHQHDHHHEHGACCGHSHARTNPLACLSSCCPVAKIVFTRSFWAASVVAFLVIFATDWLLHTRILMQDYAETSALWRADGEIRHSLIFLTQALTAMAYAAIIIGLGHAGKWFGSFSSGVLAGSLPAIGALTSYVMLPFASPYIPAVWAAASLIQGGLAGIAICAALKASRAPDVAACCAPKSTLH